VPVLQLLLWVRTCWASLYNFLDRILVLRKVCMIFFCYAQSPEWYLLTRASIVLCSLLMIVKMYLNSRRSPIQTSSYLEMIGTGSRWCMKSFVWVIWYISFVHCFWDPILGACWSPSVLFKLHSPHRLAHNSSSRVLAGDLEYHGALLKIYRDFSSY